MAVNRGASLALLAVVVAAAGAMFAVSAHQHQPTLPDPSPSASTLERFETLEKLEARVEKEPDNPQLQLALGNAYFDHKEYGGAIKAYQEVLAAKPDYLPARVDMATAYFYAGEKAIAITQYQKVLKQDPKNVQALFNLGLAYHSQGHLGDAKMAWTQAKAVASDPVVRRQIDEKLKQVAWTANPK